MLAKIKSSVGRILPRQRYADTSDAQTPDEQIDPEEWHHDAQPGLGERLKRSKRTLLTFGAFIVVGIGILAYWSRQFVVGAATNPVVQAVAYTTVVFLVAYVAGIKSFRGRLEDWDWLILQLPGGTLPLLGELQQADDGTTIFTPYSGIDWLGHRERQLQLGELGTSTARTLAKRGRDMDSGARIRVDDAIAATRESAFGTVTAVMTERLEVDEFGQHSDVYTYPPDTVNAEQYRRLRDRLDDFVNDEIPRLRAEVNYQSQQIEQLRTRLRESGDDRIEKFIDRYAQVEQARQPDEPDPLDEEDETTPLAQLGDDDGPLMNGGTDR